MRIVRQKKQKILVPVLGDNSYQLLPLDVDEVTGPVKSLSLVITRSAGIASLAFCYPPVTTTAPTPTAAEPSPELSRRPVVHRLLDPSQRLPVQLLLPQHLDLALLKEMDPNRRP
jgi:hypothetical protein